MTKLLGTLGAETAISVAVTDVVEQPTRCSSVKAVYSMNNFTTAAQKGPITVGVCHADYTNAEIEEWIENTGSWSQSDLVQQEVAGRKIRIVGQFPSPSGLGSQTLNDGKPITTKLNWLLLTGATLKFFWYNEGSGALDTTDPTVHVNGHANLWGQA